MGVDNSFSVDKVNDAFFGEDKREPEYKALLELLNSDKATILKSELSKNLIPFYVRANSFSKIMNLGYYDIVIKDFLEATMAKDRKRVKEFVDAMLKEKPNKKRSVMDWVLGRNG